MKKYIPKYYPTRNESFDSDELHYLIHNIRSYENKRELLRILPFIIILALATLYFLTR